MYDPSLCLTREVPSAETCGDGVTIGVRVAVLVEVESGVLVEGLACAVCIAAVLAVPATMVESELASSGPALDDGESPCILQARVVMNNIATHNADLFLYIRLLLEIKNSSRLLYAERNKELVNLSMQFASSSLRSWLTLIASLIFPAPRTRPTEGDIDGQMSKCLRC